jgi:hypothetical protein
VWTSSKREEKRRDQYDIAALFAMAILDVTGTPPRGRSDGTPVGYSRRAALRREQCDMMPESQNNGPRRDGRC